jgi:alanine racemase
MQQVNQRDQSKDLIWLEVSRGAFSHNLRTIKNITGDDVKIAACIKGNAYGHGLVQSARVLQELGVDWLCVFNPDEVLALRAEGITLPVLILGYVPGNRMLEMVQAQATLLLSDVESAQALSEASVQVGKTTQVHVKLDSGLSRYGVRQEEFIDFARRVSSLPCIEVTGVATHFATSDAQGENTYFHDQLELFEHMLTSLSEEGITPEIRHAANSAAVLRYPESHLDMVRPGRALYGYFPRPDDVQSYREQGMELKQVLRVKTRVTHLKKVPKGTAVSYGCTYVTERESILAVLPVGYADGYSRFLSNCGNVLVQGKRAPIRGKVSMNVTIVDVTDIPGVEVGDEVVLLGSQGDENISTYEMAELCMQTLPYNIITAFQETLPRYLVE